MPSLAASARSLKAPSFSTCQSIVAEKCGSSASESIPAPHIRPVCQKSKQQRLNSVNIRRAGLPRQFSGLQHDIPSCNQLCRLAPSRRRHVQCRAGKEGPASPPYKVVITGSSKGIGLALAKQFLAAGDKVCFCARDADQLEAQCKELEKEYPGQTLSRATDVTKASDVAALAEFVKKEMGNVDIWINNAGTNAYTYKPLVENSDEDIEQIVATNTLGVMLCCRQAIKLMRDQSSRGHVFNMDGAGADGNPTPRFAAYGATKRGLAQFTKSLQAELKLLDIKNVTVHNLSPGMVTTDLLMAGADRQQARFFINALAEPPDVVAEFLVPRIRATVAEADGKSKYIRFLTSPKAYTQILARLLFKSRKDRYVKEADG